MGAVPFETLVETHHAEIHRYLARVTGRSAEADDLAQETFLRAFRTWRMLPDDANVRAWLFTIATNLSRNHFRGENRRSRAHAAVQAVTVDHGHDRPDGEAQMKETVEVVEGVVEQLPFKQRSAFILRKVHDLDYDAIGGALSCSPESARAHVFQALKKIRASLDGHALLRPEVVR
jgi:RNA polymerase sigma-70 factor (ECF subfamily)